MNPLPLYVDNLSPRYQAYVLGQEEERPGTFMRDLSVAMNQVPRWAWIGVGLGLLGLGVYSWRKGRKP